MSESAYQSQIFVSSSFSFLFFFAIAVVFVVDMTSLPKLVDNKTITETIVC